MKPLLILGVQRSGTTLLASMLGRHPEISMLFESTSKDVLKLIGKEYQGNKLCTWRQIRFSTKATKWGHFVNRLVNFHFIGSKYQVLRPYPTSQLSIKDYLEKGAILIHIRRDKESIVKSLVKRTPLTEKQAVREFERASLILDEINDQSIEVDFVDLVNKPKEIMLMLCDKLGIEFDERMMEGPKYNIIYPNSGFLKEKAESKGRD